MDKSWEHYAKKQIQYRWRNMICISKFSVMTKQQSNLFVSLYEFMVPNTEFIMTVKDDSKGQAWQQEQEAENSYVFTRAQVFTLKQHPQSHTSFIESTLP